MAKFSGLTNDQVLKQEEMGHVNKAVDDQAKTDWQIIKENTFTYFNLIFLILAILLILVGEFKDLTFLPVIIANTVIGIIQELRAKRVLDKLNVINATKVTVIRNNIEQEIPIENLVLDDIIVLKTGDQIPADSVVLDGSLKVNEALLTGEADEILKKQDDDLLSGSFVVSGKAYAKLTKVGKESYVSKLTLKAKEMNQKEQSEMIRSLNKLIKWVGIIIIPLGLALFAMAFYVNHHSIAESVTSMEAAIIGMIPEGLYLLTTIALAISAMRLAKNQVMLHDMKSVETLARVNVLCVDKTGTITEPKMAVTSFEPINIEKDKLFELISNFAQSMPQDNETSKALGAYFTSNRETADHIIPFTSVNKYSGAVFKDKTLLVGAPEFVLRNQFDEYKSKIDSFTRQGYRVVAFAKYPQALKNENDPLTQEVELLGLILINNPIRKNAKKTFKYFAKQGVEIKVISGDNPLTVSRVAKEVGIAGSEKYIDATELNKNNYDEAVKKYNVFGRVKPEQKRYLVKALQKAGNTVAMTGDGVNDILAMKLADCSISMASGNNAAVQASQVVLLDSNFAKMPEIVNEGRRVVNNIERSASLFLVKNIFSLLMTFFTLAFALTYPLRPTQIALISAFTIGLPSFLLALENNFSRIRGKFIPNVMTRAIPGGITDMIAVSVLVIVNQVLDLGRQEVATTATMLLIAVGMMVLYQISAPMNKYRVGVFIVSFLCLIFAIIFAHNLFALSKISMKAIFLLVILFFAEVTAFKYLSKLADGFQEVLNIYSQKGSKTTIGELKLAYKKADR
ncbi:cation-translocating P-type ATPase [Lactobacillus hominis]|uniref:cation-translocating P-type ATPase n=1 Tax=Lactobacillus hominis TaxID=1203033 RepID=UPI0023F4AFFB|nr:cation-translocating P-type ATPase [Lactobacillus hominis]